MRSSYEPVIKAIKEQEKIMGRPDFGEIRDDTSIGITLTCKAIAPGLSLHDLVMAFDAAQKQAKPGDEFAGDPSRWPVTKGVEAVATAILDAIYGK